MLECGLQRAGKCTCTTKCVKLKWYEKGRADAIKDFGEWLAKEGYDSSCHNIKAWITEYENKDKKEQK